MCLVNYLLQWWVEFDDELSWLFTNRFRATRYMKVKRMGITEILRRIWLFSANEIKSSESFSKQPIQLIVELNSSLRHIIVPLTLCCSICFENLQCEISNKHLPFRYTVLCKLIFVLFRWFFHFLAIGPSYPQFLEAQ